MAKIAKTKKFCGLGHTYYKSSDCPVCPLCSKTQSTKDKAREFPATLAAPALRALLNAEIDTLKKLAKYTEAQILELHGIGPSSIPKLRNALKSKGLKFIIKNKSTSIPETVSEYIEGFSHNTRVALRQVRQTIRKAAPKAEECISYGMPGYKLAGKPLVYFAGYENHIGFYATPSGNTAFRKELSKYKQGKGSVQFPLSEPMPLALISRIVRFRMKQNERLS
jgi:uncharacterized protein YdhG (YjbR/CyaY superfamily)